MEKLTFEQLPQAVSEILVKLENIERMLDEKHAMQQSKNQDQILNVQETASFLGLVVPTIYSKVSNRELPVMKRSNRLYFSRKELVEYLKEGRQLTYIEIEEQADEYLMSKSSRY